MAVDFNKFNEQFGGADALKALEEAKKNEYKEVPDGLYDCKLESLELGESKNNKPMIKAQFRINVGEFKKQCLFLNQVITPGFPMHKGLEFLRSLEVFDESEIDFNGDFNDFNNLLMDIAEEVERNKMSFGVKKTKDGDFTRIEVKEVYED